MTVDAVPQDRPPAGWQLRLLGPAAWRMPGHDWFKLASKDAAWLARLALDGPQPRTVLAHWLWPDVPSPRAHANLRQRLLRLRRQAGDLVLEADGVLRLHPAVACDISAQGCSDALALDAGLLAGVEGVHHEALQAWLDDVRRKHQARRADLMLGQASAHEARGELAAALAVTERLLSLEPLLEHAWRRLMRLHSQRGDRAAALAAFERCEQVLRDELGVKPDPETLACLHSVETGEDRPAPPAGELPTSLVRPPQLVGRDGERAAMAAAWQLGSAFLLLGDAGLGKSRLMLDCAAAGPARIIETARPGDEDVPYATVVRLLRALQRGAPRPGALWPDEASAADERRELARLLPEMGPTPPAHGMQALLTGALDAVFLRAPGAGVQAVLVDDLQHADEASLQVLQRASGQPGLRWGFASRPDSRPAAGRWPAGSTRLHTIPLAGLAAPALQDLLQSCRLPGLDRPEQAHHLARDLARHCAGNPLFVLETLRHLVLHGGVGAAAGTLPLPPTVEALLADRLLSLSPAAQDLARVAAVAGTDLDAELAADVLQQPLLALAAPWRELEAAQVLHADGFVHDLLRQAALARLPLALRRPLHARIAHSLRARQAEPQRVMAHCLAGGLPAEAGAMALAAAARARSLGRLQERLQRLREASDCFVQAGQPDRAFEARMLEVGACYALEGAPPALALLDRLLPQAIDHDAAVQMHLEQAGLLLSQYDAAGCGAAAAAAARLAAPGSTNDLSARLLGSAAQAMGGDAHAAAEQAGPLRERLLHTADPPVAVNLWGYLAMVYALAGRHDDSIQALQNQRALAQAAGQADDEATALSSLVSQYVVRGDLELAVADGRRAVALQQRLGAPLPATGALLNLAMAQVGLHALHDALDTLQRVHQACPTLPGAGPELACIAQDTESEAWLRAQQPQRAWASLRALAPGAAVSAPRQVGRLAQQARVLQALGRADEAQALWRQVLQAPVGSLSVLRGRLLAALALGAEVDHLVPEVDETARTAPRALRALASWVQAEQALRRRDTAAAHGAALRLQSLLPGARHCILPEAEARQRLCALLQQLGTPAEAAAERLALQQWHRQVLDPAVRAVQTQPTGP